MSNDLFDDKNTGPVIDPNKDYTVELVGEGKKFKDVPSLARGKVESDYFIKSLQEELSGLRQELQKRDQLSEMIEKLGKREEPVAPPALEQRDPTPKNEVNLDELFEKKFAERKAIEAREKNVRETQTKLQAAFGADYVKILQDKARELNVDKEVINDLAARSPDAVLRLVGVENKPAQRSNDLFTPPPASQASGFTPSSSVRDKAYYDKMKKENPQSFWHKDNQVQMHKDAIALGDKFFGL